LQLHKCTLQISTEKISPTETTRIANLARNKRDLWVIMPHLLPLLHDENRAHSSYEGRKKKEYSRVEDH
jgi:hypothetical protein